MWPEGLIASTASDVEHSFLNSVRLRLTKIRCAYDDALSQVEGLQV